MAPELKGRVHRTVDPEIPFFGDSSLPKLPIQKEVASASAEDAGAHLLRGMGIEVEAIQPVSDDDPNVVLGYD